MGNFNQYTKFTRHVDNAKETISANDLNTIQKSVNVSESGIIALNDNAFLNRTLFSFNHNVYGNTIFVDVLDTSEYIDLPLSSNITYQNREGNLKVGDITDRGYFITNIIKSSNDLELTNFILLTEEYIPLGGDIQYYITVGEDKYHPIKSNDVSKPYKITPPHVGTSNVRIKVEMRKNSKGETPIISAWALMYFDPELERTYGLTNPDLDIFEGDLGNIVLLRDRLHEDRLIRVLEPNMVTELFYNDNGELDKVETLEGSKRLVETMIYGNYLNSKGAIERVLLQVNRKMMPLTDELDEGIFVDEEDAP